MKSPNYKSWTWISIALLVACCASAIALGQEVRLISLLVLPPLVAGLTTTPRRTAIVSAMSLAAAIALGFEHEREVVLLTTAHALRVVVVGFSCALAVQTSILRERDLRTRRRLSLINSSRDQLEAASGIEEALTSLSRAAVFADFAEFAILDIRVPDGTHVRVVERMRARRGWP